MPPSRSLSPAEKLRSISSAQIGTFLSLSLTRAHFRRGRGRRRGRAERRKIDPWPSGPARARAAARRRWRPRKYTHTRIRVALSLQARSYFCTTSMCVRIFSRLPPWLPLELQLVVCGRRGIAKTRRASACQWIYDAGLGIIGTRR